LPLHRRVTRVPDFWVWGEGYFGPVTGAKWLTPVFNLDPKSVPRVDRKMGSKMTPLLVRGHAILLATFFFSRKF